MNRHYTDTAVRMFATVGRTKIDSRTSSSSSLLVFESCFRQSKSCIAQRRSISYINTTVIILIMECTNCQIMTLPNFSSIYRLSSVSSFKNNVALINMSEQLGRQKGCFGNTQSHNCFIYQKRVGVIFPTITCKRIYFRYIFVFVRLL